MMGFLPGMTLPNCGVQGVSALQGAAAGANDGACFSAMLGGANAGHAGVATAAAAAAAAVEKKLAYQFKTTGMPSPYAMALNNAMATAMLGQIGGMEAQKAETRRREQRRLSAQRRRERKRGTLSELEAKVSAAKQMDADLREQLNQHLAGTTSADASPAQAVMDNCDPATLEPVFPVWKEILDDARKEARQGNDAESGDGGASGSDGVSTANSTGGSVKDKLTVRRERNRISARMSRLRKRLRQEYLEKNLDLLSKRIDVIKSALKAGAVPIALRA
jgi:hypothetical protein